MCDAPNRRGCPGRCPRAWTTTPYLDDDALHGLLFGARDGSAQGRPLLDWATVHKEMRRKGVTLMLLWLEYKEANPDGYAYTQFTRLYKAWKRSLDVVMRQDHKAGERLFVDFPGEILPIYDPKTSQVAMRAELFVAALGASGTRRTSLGRSRGRGRPSARGPTRPSS